MRWYKSNTNCCTKHEKFIILPRKDYYKLYCYSCECFVKIADEKEVLKLKKEGKAF